MYKLITAEQFKSKIEEWDDDANVFYRFQNPNHEVGEKSWGMIFGSEEEAMESAEEWGLTPEEAVLPGKSCTVKFDRLIKWCCEFGRGDIVIAFKGYDTYVSGHDGEYVAEFEEVIAAITYSDYCAILKEME